MPQTAKKGNLSWFDYERLCAEPPVLTQEKIFNCQIQELVIANYAKYEDADALRSRIPENGLFLIVPPRPSKLDLDGLMAKVILDGRTGQNFLDSTCLEDISEYPTTTLLLTDIDDGRKRMHMKPIVSYKTIVNENRIPYTTWFGIIHATIFPWVLERHYLDLVGSRYRGDDVPAPVRVRRQTRAPRGLWVLRPFGLGCSFRRECHRALILGTSGLLSPWSSDWFFLEGRSAALIFYSYENFLVGRTENCRRINNATASTDSGCYPRIQIEDILPYRVYHCDNKTYQQGQACSKRGTRGGRHFCNTNG